MLRRLVIVIILGWYIDIGHLLEILIAPLVLLHVCRISWDTAVPAFVEGLHCGFVG